MPSDESVATHLLLFAYAAALTPLPPTTDGPPALAAIGILVKPLDSGNPLLELRAFVGSTTRD